MTQDFAVLAQTHYENFPVASALLPKSLRHPIQLIYAFARQADDFADEGDLTPEARLSALNDFESKLDQIAQQQAVTDPFFKALEAIIYEYELPIQYFYDLLKAFKQDVIKQRYATMAQVYDYCQYSANPVGRLLLQLCGQHTDDNVKYSDAICTALQLINFYQDIASDIDTRDRCYLPLALLNEYGISEADLIAHDDSEPLTTLVNKLVLEAEALLRSGKLLIPQLPGRFKWEISLTIHSALQVVASLKKRSSIYERPTLKAYHWPQIIVTTLKNTPVFSS